MKKILITFLSFVIFIAPPFAYAGIGKYIINTVKHTPNAVKVSATSTATGAKHVINHGVSSNAMAGAIGGGLVSMAVGGGVGLAFEVITGLALDAVDWVMDAENNELKWKEKGAGSGSSGSNSAQYRYCIANTCYYTPETACRAVVAASPNFVYHSYRTVSPNSFVCRAGYGESKPDDFMSINFSLNPDYNPNSSDEYQKIPLPTLAQKTIDLANGGNKTAQKTVEDYVKKIAERGDLDAELDAATDITKPEKECPINYEKVGNACIKKPTPEKECPADTVRVGEKCIKKPKEEEDGQNCGGCCDEMLSALGAIADMNAQFYDNSLDNDATMLSALNAINDNFANMSSDFNDLLDAANLTNDKLSEISTKLADFNVALDALKKSIDDGNADILAKLADVDASIQDTNALLDKVNDNLEKMQKCEETEFNKKICDFIDWVQGEPETPEVTETPEVLDVQAENSNKINMSGECPAPYELNFSVLGHQQNNSISYQPLCSALVLLKPIFIGSGALSGMFILMGYSRPSGTGSN